LKAQYIELVFPCKNKKIEINFLFKKLPVFPKNAAFRTSPVFDRNLPESHVKRHFASRSKNRRAGYETQSVNTVQGNKIYLFSRL